ncbi:MAG: hypothetical protein ACIAQZ_05175 [Sedimentisphaeraceae bacterium JB056]
MAKISKKQRDFLDCIIDSRIEVEAAMEQLGISSDTICRWFSMEAFTQEITRRIDVITRRADMIISQNRLLAAKRLVKLTNCEKEETARKACLDILELTAAGKVEENQGTMPQISQQTAAKLLEILANEKQM